MPKLVLPVPETLESVTRPVVLDITRQIFKITRIPKETRIYYPGDLEKDRQPGTSMRDDELFNTFGTSPKITVDVDETYESDRILSTAVYQPENLFIFRDDRLDTYIKPAYVSTELSINFRFRSIDKVSAIKWRDDIRTHVSMMRDENLHDLTYHYLIPKEYIAILEEIHRLRELVAGYGEDFDTFLKANLTQRASLLTNLSGAHQEWGISERQMRIVGWFDFEGAPELGQREGEDDSWTISFAYKFKFDKPVECVLQYPLVVHNQLLSSKYRPTEPAYQVEHYKRSYALSAQSFAAFERTRDTMRVASLPGIAVPSFDEFIPNSVVPQTLRVFTILTTIDEAEPRLLFNLTDIGRQWQLDDDVLEYLRQERATLSTAYKGVYGLQLYRNTDLMPDGSLTVDADLNVRMTSDPHLRNCYHVRLSIVTDLTLVDPGALTRLREHGPVLIKTIDAIDPSVLGQIGPVSMLGNGYVTRDYLNLAVDEINRARLSEGDGQTRQFNTVMALFVQAFNKE